MEIAKDEMFRIKYNAKLDKLEIAKENKFSQWCKQHKIMTVIIGTTIVAIGIDAMLLYQFFQILSTL